MTINEIDDRETESLLAPSTSITSVRSINIPTGNTFINPSSYGLSGSYTSASVSRGGVVYGGISSSSSKKNNEVVSLLGPDQAVGLANDQDDLLRDNHLQVPRHPRSRHASVEEAAEFTNESNQKFDLAIKEGKITSTTWKREIVVIIKYTVPMVITFCLQYSLTVASVFSVGHLGKRELAAVSLASMTANITGYAVFQGLATCLDTLCAQAFGNGDLIAVGVHFQQCSLLLLVVCIPTIIIWFFSGYILTPLVPEEELAWMACHYLRVLSFGLPGYVLFETGKRFLQAQGIFHASTLTLLVAAPFNGVLNYLLVYDKHIGIGYTGAPLAVVITDYLMPLLLLLYVYYIDGSQCWGGFTRNLSSIKKWIIMLKLAIPGLVMIEAEYLAFEIITLAASYFGTTALAAQSVLSTLSSLTYQVPFAMSVAASTRVANFIGAKLPNAAKKSSIISMILSLITGLLNMIILFLARDKIGQLFTSDKRVIKLVGDVIPVPATFQLVDGLAAVCNGILRGQGRQSFGGYLSLIAYYLVAMPAALILAFKFHQGLWGLWSGISIALLLISIIETIYILNNNWNKIVEESAHRIHQERITAIEQV